ncbi:GCN5-related N-acetyltransferase [Thalassoporum mexicanum PCC 7367]|uniref:GNAT family N-acetyltransferase n=1 Tax=Thalassoporum mexicanum TaxID=3457544 RepID=UPI00029FB2AC|nr:GNAT family N-acetyltransferase [Pseudanabaena sp. PCC 7367]AFY70533.1 GCN5-related N-acetyltransferase [Pseudanabaena sp. PCC 7367]
MANNYTIALEELSTKEDIDQIEAGLTRYNRSKSNLSQPQDLSLLIRDSADKIWGGLFGITSGKRLYVDMLWLDQTIRHQGYGSKLMHMAEQEAIARGCTLAYLDTASFQAPEFYRKMGYEIFGEIQAPGEEFSISYFCKVLD